MTSSAKIQQCDYLRSHTLPHVFTSERAELVYLNEQISSLDSHLSQLNALRRVLHDRSCQLHNMFAPVCSLPMEVLSYIFQQFVNLSHFHLLGFLSDHQRLRRALTLSSVSSSFRHVALHTPALWNKITLNLTSSEATRKASSLLQRCIALAPSIAISVVDELDKMEARSVINILLTSEVTSKVGSFALVQSVHASQLWIDKLKGSSFPILDTLKVLSATRLSYDFGTLKTLTRLTIRDYCKDRQIIVPPSVQHLHAECETPYVFLSLLYQCPNLVECAIGVNPDFSDDLDGDTQFTEPLTLNHLKQLAISIFDAALVERIQLPLLETLQLDHENEENFITALPLCRNVSATLTILHINFDSVTLKYDDLHQLCRLSFPKLTKLEFWSSSLGPFLSAVHVLALLDGEFSNPETRRMPALKSIFLSCDGDMTPHSLLDLLKKWRIGEAFHFDFQLDPYGVYYHDWSLELREELRSIVGGRRIEVEWGGYWI